MSRFPLLSQFEYFIKERETVRVRKEAGAPKPWTNDVILQEYKFCNIKREDDTVTQWLFEMVYNTRCDPLTVFACRMFNWPGTLLDGVRWKFGVLDIDHLIEHAHERVDDGHKVFSAAYVVSTNGRRMDKIEYVGELLREADKRGINGLVAPTLHTTYDWLRQFRGLGSFMAGQVIADLKHFDPTLKNAEDWSTWCTPGPGSKRGLNRVCGYPVAQAWSNEKVFRVTVEALWKEVHPLYRSDMQNLQNCLCEFDKYMRAVTGEGRPKARYPGRG